MDLQTDWRILNALLDHGPSTTTQLLTSANVKQAAAHKAIQRMAAMGVVCLNGRGPRKPGSINGSTPYVVDVGPRIRLWALRTIKPKQDDE